MKIAFTYIQIIETASGKVVSRVDVTGSSERTIERIESGMNINLNHDQYHTDVVTSEKSLEEIITT